MRGSFVFRPEAHALPSSADLRPLCRDEPYKPPPICSATLPVTPLMRLLP